MGNLLEDMPLVTNNEHAKRGVSRRSLVNGAAWSIPVIAVATATPFASASCGTPGNELYAPGVYDLTLPDCVSSVTFEVVGGGATGAAAGLIQGTLALPSRGVTLRLVVGANGGFSSSTTVGAVGGAGYGAGGSAQPSARGSSAGGGGSAILIGTTPYVVAGGAGGTPTTNANGNPSGPTWGGYGATTSPLNGAPYGNSNGGPTPGNGRGRTANFYEGTTLTRTNVAGGQPGRAANAGTGGAGGAGLAYNNFPTEFTAVSPVTGGAGGNFGTGSNGGGNGGAGFLMTSGAIQGVTGAGGGGYAGGGGGGGAIARHTASGFVHTYTTGGGGGSSYTGGAGVATTLVGTGTAGLNAGLIRISWT